MRTNMQNTKEWIVPLICISAVVAIVLIGRHGANKDNRIEKKDDTTPSIEWPSEQVQKETIEEKTKHFEITAYYPTTRDETISAYLKTFVTEQVDAFKENVNGDGQELPPDYPPATLDISYEERKSDRADTYVFTIYSDTGGAHGLTATKTFSFTKAGQRISLEDLFTTGTKGLGTVADYVKGELAKREFADQKWISEGAAPSADNYANFVIEDTGITFIFDPYQVAAYAAGTQIVSVPTSVFKKIANPEIFGTIR